MTAYVRARPGGWEREAPRSFPFGLILLSCLGTQRQILPGRVRGPEGLAPVSLISGFPVFLPGAAERETLYPCTASVSPSRLRVGVPLPPLDPAADPTGLAAPGGPGRASPPPGRKVLPTDTPARRVLRLRCGETRAESTHPTPELHSGLLANWKQRLMEGRAEPLRGKDLSRGC